MSNLPSNTTDLLSALTLMSAVSKHASGPDAGTLFMKFAKGSWAMGADEMEPEDGSLWAVDPMSIKQGYIAWQDGELMGEAISGLFDEPVVRSELESDLDWNAVIGVNMVCLDGADKDTQCEFKTSSKGGVKEMAKLIDSIREQVSKDATTPCPVVTLGSEHYQHKKFGRVHTPILKISKWVSREDKAESAAKIEAPSEEEPAPTRRRKRA